jgi:hypothetical protein
MKLCSKAFAEDMAAQGGFWKHCCQSVCAFMDGAHWQVVSCEGRCISTTMLQLQVVFSRVVLHVPPQRGGGGCEEGRVGWGRGYIVERHVFCRVPASVSMRSAFKPTVQ